MNEARNGKLPLVQAAQMLVVSICIPSLWLVGTQTQKALKVPLSSFLQPPGPVKVHLIQRSLCLESSQGCYRSASKVKQKSRLPWHKTILLQARAWEAFFGKQDTLNTHRSPGLWTQPWMGKIFDSRALSGNSHVVNKDVQCNFGFILKFLEAGPRTVSGSEIFPLKKSPNATLQHQDSIAVI